MAHAVAATYPVVLLSLPLWRIAVNLSPRSAVSKLEEAGECTMVLDCVGEDGVLEVHSMRDNVVVFIHPTDINSYIHKTKFEGDLSTHGFTLDV